MDDSSRGFCQNSIFAKEKMDFIIIDGEVEGV